MSLKINTVLGQKYVFPDGKSLDYMNSNTIGARKNILFLKRETGGHDVSDY